MLYESIKGNENYANSLNIWVNYGYHSENRFITLQLPYMHRGGVDLVKIDKQI